ncbi:MAG: ABC transporter permease [Solirubrobacterales bacterium]|nr:ABC transporter permease [Solirubrobacterales bacterium]
MTSATAQVTRGDATPGRRRARPGPRIRDIQRAERRKLTAQLSTRLLALVCALGPLAFAGLLSLQNGVPADTLFGVWVHSSGYAVSLVVLGFSGSWGFPVIAGVLAGDVFSGEDRHGTWKTVLTRSALRRDVYAGKVLAAAELAVGLVALAAVSSTVGGLAFTGDQPLVGLSGTMLSPGHSLELVALSWAASVLPTLAFVALALLFSLATRNGIAGAVGPVIVALVMALLDLIGNGTWVHAALVGSAFSDWHGLFAAPPFLQPLLVGSLVSVVWTAGGLALCARMLGRRDFAGAGAPRAARWTRAGALVVIAVAAIGLLAAGTQLGPTTITTRRLQASLTPTFNRLAPVQQRELGRRVPVGTRLRIQPTCLRRGGGAAGPGDDWTCTLDVFIPQAGIEPFQQTPVTYDMSVQANGCYKATSPPSFVGQQLMRDTHGHEVVNPLYTIYGCFETDG